MRIRSAPADWPSDLIRFCPICDGYEAIDRRMGVLGYLQSAGKKALFLRIYQRRFRFRDRPQHWSRRHTNRARRGQHTVFRQAYGDQARRNRPGCVSATNAMHSRVK
jgi:hypothetical protein